MASTIIKFINHASVMVTCGKISLLSDPWYYGDSFHKGWNLLTEQKKENIDLILDKTSHIWISHEHPDHFSVRFFVDFKEKIISKSITILFQETKDKRVFSFLKKLNFDVKEIAFNSSKKLSEHFKITCIKDGFYDSALFILTKDKKILNLNDCEVKNSKRANQIKKIVGECDVLLTQFSYAAWKGGKKNIAWRKEAAKEKLNSINIQIETFKPKVLIPFASYIYFSNKRNFYLNDSINSPKDIVNEFKNKDVKVNIMKPFDEFEDKIENNQNNEAINFWENQFKELEKKKINYFEIIDENTLSQSFLRYKHRIFLKNNKLLIFLARYLSPIKVFKKVIIYLDDIEKTAVIDLLSKKLIYKKLDPDLVMSSDSLNFIMNNPFGFDTLTVNGCFEEFSKGGFIKAAKTLSVENLNNMGIMFNFKIFFNLKIILIFFERIRNVKKKS